MTAMIQFLRQLGVELLASADELDLAVDQPDAVIKPGDTVRVIAMAIVTASKKTLLA